MSDATLHDSLSDRARVIISEIHTVRSIPTVTALPKSSRSIAAVLKESQLSSDG